MARCPEVWWRNDPAMGGRRMQPTSGHARSDEFKNPLQGDIAEASPRQRAFYLLISVGWSAWKTYLGN